MAKCILTGKHTLHGRTIQHNYGGNWFNRAQKKNRTFKINAKKLTIKANGRSLQLNVSARGLKNIKLIQRLYV